MGKKQIDAWNMLKEELVKQGFDNTQIINIYKAISATCDRRGTTSIKV